MTLSLDTAYRSFGGEVEALSTPTICRLPDSRRHQLWAIAPRVEWHGLKDRTVRDPLGLWMNNWTSHSSHRVATGSWPLTSLTDAWPEIVAELAAPVMRSFTTEFVLSADWIRGQAPKWLRE